MFLFLFVCLFVCLFAYLFVVDDDVVIVVTSEVLTAVCSMTDVAANVYIAYTGLCLFWNTPLKVYNTTLLVRLRRHAFRVPKLPFIAVVIMLWWFYAYFLDLLVSPQISLYLHNVQVDPCYAQPEFFAQRNEFIISTCRSLNNLQVCVCGARAITDRPSRTPYCGFHHYLGACGCVSG